MSTRAVFFGSGSFGEPTLRAMVKAGVEIPFVVTQPARGSGRGRAPTPTPIETVARALSIPIHAVENVNDPAFVQQLQASDAQIGVVVAFGQKIGPAARGAFSAGCINLHASLLPAYRGAAPINWAIVKGEAKTGVTVFQLVDRMDAGPIHATRETPIEENETAGDLHDRLAIIGVDAVLETLGLLEEGMLPPGRPQDDQRATKAPKLSKRDGYISPALPAQDFVNHVCGFSPWPGVTMNFVHANGKEEHVVILRARVSSHASNDEPPGVLDAQRNMTAKVGSVQLDEVRPASGRIMSWRDFVNGRRVSPGDRFEQIKEQP